MPLEKPKKPTELVPRAFGGIKNNFSDDLQSTGFEPNIPQTYNGDNLNYHLDATGKELEYVEKVVDFINQAPVNHIPFVNENNQLDYVDASSLGGGAFDMFDTKISDHILENKESKGWALQGTYVYKNGGTDRVGYPDFYNRCLEEYQDKNNEITSTRVDSGIAWVQPTNPTGISAQGWNNPNNLFDGDDSTYSEIPANTQGYIEYDFGEYLSVSGFNITGKWVNSSIQASWIEMFAVDSTGAEISLGETKDVTNKADYTGTCTFDPVICNKVRFRIYSDQTINFKTRLTSINITANTTTGYATYKNPNGHQFYNITDKPIIDEIYNQYGIADFYGIDEENERVFLPRNKYFLQLTDDTSKVNQMVEAGLPDHTHTTPAPDSYAGSGTGQSQWYGNSQSKKFTTSEASSSNSIYGNSDTVQPPSSLKLLYYCVGNTQVTESISNVTEITTSENDTLPWGFNFYSGELLEAPVGYIESQGQWNSGNDWQSFYDRAVAKIGQAFANGYIKNHTDSYDEYDLVINQDDMTFRLPIFNGSEEIPNLEAEQVLAVVASGKPVNIPYNGFLRIRCTDSTYVNINQLPMGSSNVSASSFTINEFSGLLQKGEAIPYFTGTMTNMYFIPARGNGKLYFKLANAVQDLNLLNVGEMTNGLANKVDLSNTNWAISACMPDYTAGVTKSNNVDYTAEVAGLLVTYSLGNKNCYIYINGKTVGTAGGSAVNVIYNNEFFVDKNDTYKCTNWEKITFYPLKGAN